MQKRRKNDRRYLYANILFVYFDIDIIDDDDDDAFIVLAYLRMLLL